MRTDLTVSLNGINLHDLSPLVYVEDIHEEPKVAVETESRGSYGLTVVNTPERDQLDIVVELLVKQPDRLKRQSIISEIKGWAKKGWLETNLRDNQRIYVVCSKPMSHKVLKYSESLEITFTAYDEAYWQEVVPAVLALSGSSGSGSITARGTRDCFIEADVKNVSGSTVTSVAITVGGKTMTFSGLSLANNATLSIWYDERHILRATVSGTSVMSALTEGSPDHLKIAPKTVATVSFSASGSCQASIYARGMFD